jgi:hypothetical protein
MKTFTDLLMKLALLIVALLMGTATVNAQSEQLERDMRIAERILEEIFALPSSERQIIVPAMRGAEGEYIPGIGVHFKIAQGVSQRILISPGSRQSDSQNARDIITEEWVQDRMTEYFKRYAAQLRGLPAGEQIRITFGGRTPAHHLAIYSVTGEKQTQLPRLTMWTTKADVDRFASGNLTESRFLERIRKQDLSALEEKRDLNIFASVVETGINAAGSEHLRVSRKPSYEYLPGLGVHFQVNMRTGTGFSFSQIENIARQIDESRSGDVEVQIELGDIASKMPADIDFRISGGEIDMDSLRIRIRGMNDSLRVRMGEIQINREEIQRQAEEARRLGEQLRGQVEFRFSQRDTLDLSADSEKVMNEMKSIIRNYGPTLTSLGEDELLMITINWPQRNPTIPEKTHIRISKKDINAGRQPVIQ